MEDYSVIPWHLNQIILTLKLFLTPLLIALATLSGRKWEPTVSSRLIGLLLTSGPVSLILDASGTLAAPDAAAVSGNNNFGAISGTAWACSRLSAFQLVSLLCFAGLKAFKKTFFQNSQLAS
jgi:hypothetical protein